MSDRASIPHIIHEAYAARDSGDIERCLKCLGPDASFRLVGGIGGSPPNRATSGPDELRKALQGLFRDFIFVDRKIDTFVVDGDRAGVHSRVKLRYIPNGNVLETELFDLWHVKDGKVVSLIEFADTAGLEKMTQ
jgi:ketosteroid isomerase-like protein